MWCRSWQPKVVTSFARKRPLRSSAFPWPHSANGGKQAKGLVRLACATRFFMISKVSSRCDQISQASFRRIIAGATSPSIDPTGSRVGPAASVVAPRFIGWQIDSGEFPAAPCNIGAPVSGLWPPPRPAAPKTIPRAFVDSFRKAYRSQVRLDRVSPTRGCVRNAPWPAWPLRAF
jgi:hypothetical protein